MRVALLTNIPAPYRMPVYRVLAATPGWTLRVFVDAEREFDRSWRVDTRGVDLVRVRGLSLRRRIRTRGEAAAEQEVTLHLPWGLPFVLRRFRPDVVVSVELGPRTLLAYVCARLLRVPLVVWSYHSRVGATSAGRLRTRLRRFLLRRADAVVGMGRQAREVLREHGVPDERLFDAPNAHDPGAVAASPAGRDHEVEHLRWRHGLRDRVALVAGRLVPVKGIAPLLRAWDALPEALREKWSLLFVGDGPLASEVEAAGRGHPPGEIVRLAAVEPEELAALYAATDLLVFPSLGDQWGLVVNEAMACGVPVLCSRLAGCADDLVEPGKNGFLCDPTDAQRFARDLAAALASPDLPTMGAAARETAGEYRPDRMAGGIRAAVEHAVRRRRGGPGGGSSLR